MSMYKYKILSKYASVPFVSLSDDFGNNYRLVNNYNLYVQNLFEGTFEVTSYMLHLLLFSVN